MNMTLRMMALGVIVVYFLILLGLLKKKALNLKYTLLWFMTGCIMIIVLLFPDLLEIPLHMIGVVEFVNGLFALLILLILIILISLTSIVSGLNNKLRELTQKIAIYEKRIRELEDKDK